MRAVSFLGISVLLSIALLALGIMLVLSLILGFIYVVAKSLISGHAIDENRVDYDRERRPEVYRSRV